MNRVGTIIFALCAFAATAFAGSILLLGAGKTTSTGTTPSCTSATIGQWSVNGCNGVNSPKIQTNLETITVPGGNSGSIKIHNNNNPDVVQYSKNGAAFVTLTNNADTIVTFANGDTLKFGAVCAGSCPTCIGAVGPNTGTVSDNTTGVTLDTFSVTE